MSITREEVAAVVVETMAEQMERLRADLNARLLDIALEMQRPEVTIAPNGDFLCNGKKTGNIASLFKSVVDNAVVEFLTKRQGEP